MIGHVCLNVPDLAAAKPYYQRLMPTLDFEVFLDEEDQIAFRPAGGKPGTYFFLYPSQEEGRYSQLRTGLQHLAFMVPTRGRVHEVHDLVQELGSRVLLAPQEFPQYPPPYYATFWEDLHGFKLEAVCHKDRD
jgi:catechol 2,3-dioxygenase-like lactoylglutathione lyase family enzyme